MKVIVQRCSEASVSINNKVTGSIKKGYTLLVGLCFSDNKEIVDKMAEKIVNLRIFEDENDKMNLSLSDVNGSILSISQFTLYAKLNGRRPSFTDAMKYADAKELYEYFNEKLSSYGINVETGIFGEDMKVSILNDGPVSIVVDSNDF